MKKLVILVFVAFLGTAIYAQGEEPAPKKHDATWHRAVFVNYKPGKVDEAKTIIAKYQSAGETAGTPAPEAYWFVTGSFDMLLIWTFKDGPSDLEWSWSPDGVAWWNAFVAQEGSVEAANKIQDDYNALVANTTSQLLRKDK